MEALIAPPSFETDIDCSKKELRNIVNRVESNDRLSVSNVTGLMNYNPNDGKTTSELLTAFGFPGSLIVGHVALESVIEHEGDAFPSLGHLPSFAHRVLTNMAELPFIDQSEPASDALRDHAPNLMLFLAVTYLSLEAAKFLRNHTLHVRASAAQERVVQAYQAGSLSWSIEPGSSVAFIGNGDPLARKIARTKPRDILQISQIPVDGPWTKLSKFATFEDTMQALDRADIGNARELLFFPITPDQEFLPSNDDHDISIERMVNHILAADVCRLRLGLDKLPITIVGSKYQSELYTETTHRGNARDRNRTVTLKRRMDALIAERGRNIRIIDPTEIIINRILEIAPNSPLMLSGTKHSINQYAHEFFSSAHGLSHNSRNKPVRVIYNRDDYPTVSEASPDDISVVLDSTQKQALKHRGIPEDRILVVSEEVMKVIGPLIDEN